LIPENPLLYAATGFFTFAANGGGKMRIGYARVSTTEQNLHLQRDALKRAGCEKIIEDTVSGGRVQRPGLERVHHTLRSGDVLAVWRLDRLGRSLKHLIELMGELEAERIGFHSVTESIDTTTPGGKLVFHIPEPDRISPIGMRADVGASPIIEPDTRRAESSYQETTAIGGRESNEKGSDHDLASITTDLP
jgi:hypothetical protein